MLYFIYLFLLFGCVMWILVPDLGWNLSPLQWEHGVGTPGPAGKSPSLCNLILHIAYLVCRIFLRPFYISHGVPHHVCALLCLPDHVQCL